MHVVRVVGHADAVVSVRPKKRNNHVGSPKSLPEKRTVPQHVRTGPSHVQFDHIDALIELKPRDHEVMIRTEDIEKTISDYGDSIALIFMGGVNYYSGQAFEMERIVQAGHAKGCVVGFDLAHAAGNLILNLHDWDVDFAVWCTYKYLNSGPGGIAGCFVHERHIKNPGLPRFAGWWGHDKKTRFLMPSDFVPMPTAEAWQLSNPPIFQLAGLDAALEMFDEVGMKKSRAKSVQLTGYLESLLDQISDKKISIITPRDPNQRGCQLSIRVKEKGKLLYKKLAKQGAICDWREPNVIRVAPVPLYNSFLDVYNFYEIFRQATLEADK